MTNKIDIDQDYINETFFGHFRYVDAKLKALSDYLNIHYYVEYDEKGKAKITVKERSNHEK